MTDIPDMPVAYRVERHCAFDRGVVELRRYLWSKPVEQTFQGTPGALVLNMALTSRPERTRVEPVAAGDEVLIGDAGRLLVMMPGARYHLFAPSGAFRSLHCAIECSKFESFFDAPIDWASLSELGGVLRPGSEIEWLLSRMRHELEHERIGQAAAIDAYATAICVELARRFREGKPRRSEFRSGGLAAWRMKLLLERIHAEAPAPGVAELAELCALTPRQLNRAFKAETGMTIGRFVDEATMERAHRLLTSTDHSIARIAKDLGFASADSFAQSYRRITGILPSQVRRR
jgi:AraC-like DNA-binding protein